MFDRSAYPRRTPDLLHPRHGVFMALGPNGEPWLFSELAALLNDGRIDLQDAEQLFLDLVERRVGPQAIFPPALLRTFFYYGAVPVEIQARKRLLVWLASPGSKMLILGCTTSRADYARMGERAKVMVRDCPNALAHGAPVLAPVGAA